MTYDSKARLNAISCLILIILLLFLLSACGGGGGGSAAAGGDGGGLPSNYQEVTQTCTTLNMAVGYTKVRFDGLWMIEFYSTLADCNTDNYYCRIYTDGFGAQNCGPLTRDAGASYSKQDTMNEWIYQ